MRSWDNCGYGRSRRTMKGAGETTQLRKERDVGVRCFRRRRAGL